MDKDRLQKLSQPTVDVYLAIEEQMLVNVAKRLARHDSLLDDDIESWQLQNMNQLEGLREENLAFIASKSDKTVEEVRKAFEEAGYGTLEEQEGILKRGVKEGKLDEAPPMHESAALASVLESYERQAKETFNLVNTTMLDQSQQAYLDIINQTTGQVLSGAQTARDAMRDTVSKWAEQGTPALIDKSGRRWSSEAYISAVMRSTSNNVANELQLTRMDEYNADLIEISSHVGARELCYPYQGAVYSKSGNHDKYPPLSSTSYGHPAGIAGINCRHVFNVFIEGISKQRYKGYDHSRNEKAYQNSQKQRYHERQIRYAKREQRMFEEMGDSEAAEKAKRKMLDRQAVQREFIKSTGRTRRYAREAIH